MRWPFSQPGRFGGCHVVKVVHDGDKSSVFLVEGAGGPAERAAVKLFKGQYDRLALQIEKNYGIPSEGDVGLALNPDPDRTYRHYPVVITIRQGREFGRRTGRRYIVQEFVEGVTLKSLVSCRDRRVARYPAAFVVQICQALHIVHEHGYVYRDLCLQNLIVQPNHRLKLIDLGFCAPADIAFAERSGTPSYMSPEQIRAEPLHPTSDIYSLGVVIYELLRLRPPYISRIGGEDEEAIEKRRQALMRMHLDKPVPELPGRISARKPKLSAIMTRCLQKAPADRFQSVDEIIELLTGKKPRAGPEGQ